MADKESSKVTGGPLGFWISVVISVLALVLGGLSYYSTNLSPFQLEVRTEPGIMLLYDFDFALIVSVDFFNDSKRTGEVTRMALVVHKVGSEENKYLLTMAKMVEIDTAGASRPKIERLPLRFERSARFTRLMEFVDYAKGEFPVTPGTYVCELLTWTGYQERADYLNEVKFELTSEDVTRYLKMKETKGNSLKEVPIQLYQLGYIPFNSRKLNENEYKQLIPR